MLKPSFIPTLIFASLLIPLITATAADPAPQADEDKKVFRKFHPDGVVEFSDQPTRGSEELKMEALPTYKFAAPPPAASTPVPRSEPQVKIKPVVASSSPYTALSITSPARNEAVRSNNGDINVSFSLTPALQAGLGHQVEYLVDGKSVLKAAGPASLKNTERGSHTLLVRVVDQSNKVLISADPITFYLLRQFKKPAAGH